MQSGKKWFLVSLALALLFLGYAGAGYTMRASDTAPFCGSCHVMYEAVRSHQASIHASVACNQCHAPQDSLESKMIFKTKAGMSDLFVNTFGTVPDVVGAKQATKDVVNSNCTGCHTMTVLNINTQSKQYCTDCHRQVPHMRSNPIALRRVADE